MAIYEITKDKLAPLPTTTLAAQGIHERYDLQRLFRDNIAAVDPDLYVLSEEFGEWSDANQRIDLLCVDRDANLVVVELKRTEDGGHMDLQAIRYAAMVHLMTFNQAIEVHATFLAKHGNVNDAQTEVLKFLEWDVPREAEFGRETRILLISGEFSKEITTAVLWLNKLELDIRCIRMRPYNVGDRVFLDIQQVLPLPEAAEYQVQLRKKNAEERQAQEYEYDFSKYDLSIFGCEYKDLYKRKLFFLTVRELIRNGVRPEQLMTFIPARRWLKVTGTCSVKEFTERSAELKTVSGASYDLRRFFTEEDELLHVNGDTYAFSNQFSRHDMPVLEKMIEAFPEAKIRVSKTVARQ
jgi:hypothetical protein